MASEAGARRCRRGAFCGRQCATSTKTAERAVGVRNCLTDEGRPLGTGLQGQVPNHLRRLWSKAMVVSTEGKGLAKTRRVLTKTGAMLECVARHSTRNCRQGPTRSASQPATTTAY